MEKKFALEESIAKYHAMVKRLFDNNSEDLFPNSSKEHSAAIIEEIMLHAKHDIKIFCSRLSADVWDKEPIRNALIKAVCRGVEISVITQQQADRTSELFSLMTSLDITVREESGSDVEFNFIVADKKMFRFERDSTERSAIASANCSELAEPLDDFFALISA